MYATHTNNTYTPSTSHPPPPPTPRFLQPTTASTANGIHHNRPCWHCCRRAHHPPYKSNRGQEPNTGGPACTCRKPAICAPGSCSGSCSGASPGTGMCSGSFTGSFSLEHHHAVSREHHHAQVEQRAMRKLMRKQQREEEARQVLGVWVTTCRAPCSLPLYFLSHEPCPTPCPTPLMSPYVSHTL